jgi:hypothetical protein
MEKKIVPDLANMAGFGGLSKKMKARNKQRLDEGKSAVQAARQAKMAELAAERELVAAEQA